jgi:hypothetical protein
VAARDLVSDGGDQVRAWGRFVTDPTGDWLDLARFHLLIDRPPGWKSEWSIRLIGADAGAVPTGGAANQVPGHISVVGTWRDDSIEVTAQSPEIPGREPIPDWTNPPCPPPPGGWRHGVAVGNLHSDIGDLESSGAMVTRVIFRPSADQEVLVVAATDIDAVTMQLAPRLPDQLCVVRSRFTRDQLNEVGDILRSHWQDWRLEGFGLGSADEHAQPFATAEPFRVTAEMADWADRLPDGLLRIHPAIRPA